MKLVMAGGGTGGHLFPAIALAQEIKEKDRGAEITFVGGKGGLEEKIIPKYGYPLRVLDVEGVKRKTGLKRARAIAKALRSTIQMVSVLRELKPDGVVGAGSYSSAPVVAAAKLLGIKTAILEQNAMPGLTNRMLGKIVDRIYISFEESREFFPGGRTILSGNPIRKEILRKAGEREVVREKFTVLVFGGSQGAKAINTAFLDASEYLTDIWNGLRVIHQTGEEGYEQAVSSYKRKGLKVEVHKFIDDMASAYTSADLVVCRAGATSLAEITALGLPSILIPYPFAADDHQSANARSLSEAGAAVMLIQDGLTGNTLAEAVGRLYRNPQELKAIRERVKSLGKPGAARMIADDLIKLITKKRG